MASLSPVSFAFSLLEFLPPREDRVSACLYLLSGILLAVFGRLLFRLMKAEIAPSPLYVTSVGYPEAEYVLLAVTHLILIFAFGLCPWVTAALLPMAVLTAYRCHLFFLSPLPFPLDYSVYKVKKEPGVPCLYLAKREIRNGRFEAHVLEGCQGLYIETERIRDM
jgi:hypothetical protein